MRSQKITQHFLPIWIFLPCLLLDEKAEAVGVTPQSAYVKALLVKIREKHTYCTDLRAFLVKHPALVLLLGFRPKVCEQSPFGFDVSKTVPTARHLRRKLQTIPNLALQSIFEGTVRDLKAEVPHLGRRTALDNKHIYAFVKQNNHKTYLPVQ